MTAIRLDSPQFVPSSPEDTFDGWLILPTQAIVVEGWDAQSIIGMVVQVGGSQFEGIENGYKWLAKEGGTKLLNSGDSIPN